MKHIAENLCHMEDWQNTQKISPKTYVCGFCGDKVSSKEGYIGKYMGDFNNYPPIIRLCPSCKSPTLFVNDYYQIPDCLPCNSVPNVPDDLNKLYDESRLSVAAGAYTASVLISRKMLMNIAVDKGAPTNKNFVTYVEYLADNGFVPPNGKGWVDYIRTKGNEATHEITLMTIEDAVALVRFVEMLLKFIYEFPSLVPALPSK